MNEKMIEKLAAKGFNRWTKGKYDRMYVNAKDLGLVCEYYKTGNVHSATFQGERVSNSEAYRMKAAKTYIDVETGEVVSDNHYLKEAAEEVLEAVKAEIEAKEAALKAAEVEEIEKIEETTEEVKTAEEAETVKETADVHYAIYVIDKYDMPKFSGAFLENPAEKVKTSIETLKAKKPNASKVEIWTLPKSTSVIAAMREDALRIETINI